MNHFISPEDSFAVEKAIQFLTTEYAKSGQNPKPVILHSLRVGFYLLELGYEKDIIIAGILHDLVEDSDVTESDISKRFNSDVTDWVMAVSFKSDIADPIEQYKEMYQRVCNSGRQAIIVKAADLHANSMYIHLVPSYEKQKMLIDKIGFFITTTQKYATEPAISSLQHRYEVELSRLNKEKDK